MEAAITQMAESQKNLEKVMEKFLSVAEEDRGKLQQVLTDQSQTQETAIGKLAEPVGQKRSYSTIIRCHAERYVSGEDPDYFFNNFEWMGLAAAWLA